MSTSAASGDIKQGAGHALSYDEAVKQIGGVEAKLDNLMSIIKEVQLKLASLERQRTLDSRRAEIANKIAELRSRKAATSQSDPSFVSDSAKNSPRHRDKESNEKVGQSLARAEEAAGYGPGYSDRSYPSTKVEEEDLEKSEEEDKRKKLEELNQRISKVKEKIEEAKRTRGAELSASGKAQVGAIQEENNGLNGISGSPDAYFKELTAAAQNFKRMGLLSA